MKRKYLLLVIIALVIVILSISFFIELNYEKVGDFSEFEYKYIVFYSKSGREGSVSYSISCSSQCIGNYTINGGSYEKIVVSKNTKKKIIDLINKYHISRWDGFNKGIQSSADDSFYLKIVTNKNKTIKASGMDRYPIGHDKFKDKLYEIINEDIEEIKDKKINIIKKYEEQTHTDNNNTNYVKFYIDDGREARIFNELFNYKIKFSGVEFNKNVILINYVTRGSGSTELSLKDIFVKDNKVEFDIEDYSPEYGTQDMAYWYIAAVVKRDDLEGLDLSDWVEPSSLK